jgi:hypothetical protein
MASQKFGLGWQNKKFKPRLISGGVANPEECSDHRVRAIPMGRKRNEDIGPPS